jgi:hypothetical protein
MCFFFRTITNQYWRPIVVDLEVLFPLIDDKKILKEGTREVKEGSGLDDMKIGRAAFDYLIARLKVGCAASYFLFIVEVNISCFPSGSRSLPGAKRNRYHHGFNGKQAMPLPQENPH